MIIIHSFRVVLGLSYGHCSTRYYKFSNYIFIKIIEKFNSIIKENVERILDLLYLVLVKRNRLWTKKSCIVYNAVSISTSCFITNLIINIFLFF